MAITCPGCHKSFNFGSLGLHLSRTTKPECRAVYKNQRSYLPGAELEDYGSDRSIYDDDNASESDPGPPPPQLFAGDYFGDEYSEDDLPGWGNNDINNHTPLSLASSESSSSDSESELELEPPATDLPPTTPDPMDDEHGRPLTATERRQAEQDIWVEPIVYQYPGHAGEMIEEKNKSGYTGYKRAVGAESENNPYAPFKSKIDWDMARWAKLRGPSSTAVTELMGIEDVRARLNFSTPFTYLTTFPSCTKHLDCHTKARESSTRL